MVSGVGTVAALLALRRAGGGHEAEGHGGPEHGDRGGSQLGNLSVKVCNVRVKRENKTWRVIID